jgi:hypothetical protein
MINNFKTFATIINTDDINLIPDILKKYKNVYFGENYEIIFLINNPNNHFFNKFNEVLKSSELNNYLVFNTFQKQDQISAEWLLLSNSIGEEVYLVDNSVENLNELIRELLKIQNNSISIISKLEKPKISLPNKIFFIVINRLFKYGINLSRFQKSDKKIKIFSRSIINQISNTINPQLYLQKELNLNLDKKNFYKLDIKGVDNKSVFRKTFFTSTSTMLFNSFLPIRLVGIFSLILSFLCLVYSSWIVFVYSQKDFTEGWVSTNLVLTLFFFVMSIILFFLSEYFILQFKSGQINSNLKNEGSKRNYLEKYDLNLKKFDDK